jgi:ComF family protein
MPVLGEVCRVCAEPLVNFSDLCHHCEEQTPAFDSVTSAFRYAWPLNLLITGFKFDGQYLLGDSLAKLMARRFVGQNMEIDLLLPTPLHPERLAQRGYNQAAVLAEHLAETFQLKLDAELLIRTVNTEAQSGKNRSQRLENLSGAFEVTRRLNGERIALVDDVLTTGVTADRMANALLKAGASSVEVWVLARTANE